MGKEFSLGLTFADVLLEPRETSISRKDADTSSKLTKELSLDIPVLSAAMDTVTGAEMAIALGKLGGMGVLHRNCTTEEQAEMVRSVKKAGVLAGAAVGWYDTERAGALVEAGCNVIFIDSAHAHTKRILESAGKMKKELRAQIVVGNIATSEAAKAFAEFADGVKVGVGPGSICTTRVVAGVGVPQLSAIMNAARVCKKKGVPVIGDGGITHSGDVVKALAGGASSVMLGSMLAGTDEAPGEVIEIQGETFKSYRGMGSVGAMAGGKSSDRYDQEGSEKYVPEGVEGMIPYKGPVGDIVFQIIGGLTSGMRYIAAPTIPDMWKQARFVRITGAGLKESHPHTITSYKKSPNY